MIHSAVSRSRRPARPPRSLAERHLHLVPSTVRRVAPQRLPRHFDVDDMLGAGNLGLLRAAADFDPSRGAVFSAYAITRIRGAIIDALRAATPEYAAGVQEALSLDTPSLVIHFADAGSLFDTLPASDDLEADILRGLDLWTAVARLPLRERYVVLRRYCDDAGPGEIAKELGVSISRVHKLHGQAMTRLRRSPALASEWN